MKTKDMVDALTAAGLKCVDGAKHIKVFGPKGLVGVVSRIPRMSSGHDPREVKRMIRKAQRQGGDDE